MNQFKIKNFILKCTFLFCFLLIVNSALNILDYTAKNALAMGQMDMYGGQAFLQFYIDVAAILRPAILIVIIAFAFRREIKAFINKIKNKENSNEENT